MFGKSFKHHLHPSNFRLEHHDPGRFVRGPWHPGTGVQVHAAFLAFRLTLALLFCGLLIWSMVRNWASGLWFIYLTHWGFFTLSLQAVISAGMVYTVYRKQRTASLDDLTFDYSEKEMPLLYKIYWVCFNTSITVAFFITILYWTLIYNPDVESDGPFALNLSVHGVNSVLSLVDVMGGGPPCRLLHFVYPTAFALVYILFNVIYWAAGGLDPKGNTYVYAVLDWGKHPDVAAGLVVGCALLLVIIHAIVWGLSCLRSHIARKTQKASVRPAPPTLSVGNFNKAFVMSG